METIKETPGGTRRHRRRHLTRAVGGSYQIHTNLESAASWIHKQLKDPDISAEEVLDTLRWAADPDEVARALAPTDRM